jgi:hypothetical protein
MTLASKRNVFGAAVVMTFVLSTGSAEAAVLRADMSIVTDQRLYSDGDHYFATLQGDGNLVVYRDDGTPFWSTQTAGSGAVRATMQADGNFVLYTAAGKAVWSTRTWGRDRIFAVDALGRAVVLRADKMKKRDRGQQNSVLGFTLKGARIEWAAQTYDEQYKTRPHGGHCTGNPRACGNDLNRETNEWLRYRKPLG